MLLITTGSDFSVDNAAARQVVADWQAHGADDITTYEFPAELGLAHDIVDPGQSNQQVEVVYPKLIELITR